MTRFVTSYTLHYQEGFRVPYSLVLIDTPGFADSSGIARDAGTIQASPQHKRIARKFNLIVTSPFRP